MTHQIAIMPSPATPSTKPPHEAGTTWAVLSSDFKRLGTIYRHVDGGHGADMRREAGDQAACLVVGGGLPRLPLTRPDDFTTGPLSWVAVATEVAELLRNEGWVVLWLDELGPEWSRDFHKAATQEPGSAGNRGMEAR